MNIYLAGIIISIIVYILFGVYAGRKVHNVEDYYVSGRNAPTLLIASSLFASMLSTNGFMGDAAYAYSGNFTTMLIINVLCGCGYVYGALFFGRYIRRAESTTMPSYFGDRFHSPRIRRFAGITTVVALTVYLLAVLQATSILMQMLTGLGNIPCLILAFSCVIIFSVYSGSQGILLTNTVMFMLFIGATLLAGPFVFSKAGGLFSLVETLAKHPETPKNLLDYHGNPGTGSIFEILLYAFNIGIMWFIAVGVSPWQCGRNLMARSEHVIFRSASVAAVLTVGFLTYLYIVALAVIPLYPNMPQPERVLIWAAREAMPQFVGVLLMTGIMAAGLSSASTFLSVISFSLASDIFSISFTTEAAKLRFSRITMFVVGLLATVLACLDFSSIRIITWVSSTVIAASWAVVAYGSVWSKTLTERGAYYSMLGGFFGYFIPKCLHELHIVRMENFFDPFFLALGVSVLCAILGSRGQSKSPQEVDFFAKMHQLPQHASLPSDYRVDQWYGWTMVAAGILFSIFFITYWALPYQALKNAI